MGILDKIKEGLGVKDLSNQDETKDVDKIKEEQELCSWIKSKVEEIRSGASRIAHEGIWMQNMASVLGFQNLFWNVNSRSFQPINRAGGAMRRNRITVNKMLPYLQNRLAKLTKNPPKYEVRPEDSTQEAKDNARFKMDILQAKWEDLDINNSRQDLVMMSEEMGHSYMGVFWDDTKGQFVIDPETNEEMFEGDMRVDVISPLEMFPDPLATCFEECKYWIRAKVRPLTYFKDQYPNGDQVKEEEVWLLSAQMQARINAMNTRGPAASGQMQGFKNSALELAYFERPCKKYPKGRMIVTANKILLKNEELPTGKIPFAKFDCVKVGGKYYSESLVTHARPVLDQYNQVIRRRADWTNKLLTGKFIYAKGSEIQREAMTDEQGEMIQYTPVTNAIGGGEPKAVDIPTIPSYAYKEEESLDGIMAEIFGIGEVSRGTLPSASVPALGMQMLIEADDARLAPQIANHESSFATIGNLILDYVQQYYKTPRKMKFLGKNKYTIKNVSGDQLEGSNDVIVVRGSMIPGSKALKRQDIANALEMGLYGDIQDPTVRQEVIDQMEYGDMDTLFIDASLEEARATKYVEQIKAGQMPDVDEADPFKVILKELKRFRLSDEYEQLPDNVKEIFLAVREECMNNFGQQSGMLPPQLSPEEEQAATQQGLANVPPDMGPPPGPVGSDQIPIQNAPIAPPIPQQAPPQGGAA